LLPVSISRWLERFARRFAALAIFVYASNRLNHKDLHNYRNERQRYGGQVANGKSKLLIQLQWSAPCHSEPS